LAVRKSKHISEAQREINKTAAKPTMTNPSVPSQIEGSRVYPNPNPFGKINSMIKRKIAYPQEWPGQKQPKYQWTTRLYKLLSFITILALITGCETMPFSGAAKLSQDEQLAHALLADGRLREAAEQYSHLASQASSREADDYRLTAVKIYLDIQDPNTAKALLAKLNPTRLTSRQQARMHILTARIALAKQDPQEALVSVRKIHSQYCRHKESDIPSYIPAPCDSADLPRTFWIEFFRTRALVHAALGENHGLKAIRDRIALDRLLTETSEIEENHRATWQLLLSLSPDHLSQAHARLPTSLPSPAPQSEILQGWLTLASIVKKYVLHKTSPDYEVFSQGLASWQTQYREHPARRFLLKDLLAITGDRPPTHIALLLPFDGIFAEAASAIRDGFLSAWFEDTKNTKRPKITIRNTTGANIRLVYNEVVSAGAKFVVGPLDKPSVALLEELPELPVPTLTLNYSKKTPLPGEENAIGTLTLTKTLTETPVTPKTVRASSLYQFTLSPESEAKQTTQRAWYDGHRRAAILTPQTPWGQRMEQAFATAWKQQGGMIVKSRAFPDELKDISNTVAQLLKTDVTIKRQQSMVNTADTKPEDEQQRLMDYEAIDCIFMAAFPREARQLQPQIKFHHMGDSPIPVYATYHVFSGAINTMLDEDLNGIIFGDMPWVLRQDPENKTTLHDTVTATWPESASKYSRFYAFGIDAYQIIPYLKRLRTRNFPPFIGETGNLEVDSQGRVNRQLLWAVIRRGKPIPDENSN